VGQVNHQGQTQSGVCPTGIRHDHGSPVRPRRHARRRGACRCRRIPGDGGGRRGTTWMRPPSPAARDRGRATSGGRGRPTRTARRRSA
jgi:hypothetical protein